MQEIKTLLDGELQEVPDPTAPGVQAEAFAAQNAADDKVIAAKEGGGQPVPPLDPAAEVIKDAATFTVVSHTNRKGVVIQEHVPDGLVTLEFAGVPRFYSHASVRLKTGIVEVNMIIKADSVADAIQAQPGVQADLVKKLTDGENEMIAKSQQAAAVAAAKKQDPHLIIPGPGFQVPSAGTLRKIKRRH